MWISFHGCLDVLQMCKRWKEQAIQITMYFHMTPSVINDMPKHWKHSKTGAWCHGGKFNPTVFQMWFRMWFIFSLPANQKHKSSPMLLWRSHWTSSHLRYLQATHRDYRKQWILSVSMGFRDLFEKMSQCASDKSTAIKQFCTICLSDFPLALLAPYLPYLQPLT